MTRDKYRQSRTVKVGEGGERERERLREGGGERESSNYWLTHA
jgi:hypothetical protein